MIDFEKALEEFVYTEESNLVSNLANRVVEIQTYDDTSWTLLSASIMNEYFVVVMLDLQNGDFLVETYKLQELFELIIDDYLEQEALQLIRIRRDIVIDEIEILSFWHQGDFLYYSARWKYREGRKVVTLEEKNCCIAL